VDFKIRNRKKGSSKNKEGRNSVSNINSNQRLHLTPSSRSMGFKLKVEKVKAPDKTVMNSYSKQTDNAL